MTYFVATSGFGMLLASVCLVGLALQWNGRPWGTVLIFAFAFIALGVQSIARTLAFPLRAPAASKRSETPSSLSGAGQGGARLAAAGRQVSLPLGRRNPLEEAQSTEREQELSHVGDTRAQGAETTSPPGGRVHNKDSRKRMPAPISLVDRPRQARKSIV